jgi:arabinogalactan oligomer/maltooligosaccharide transport system permease protein
MFLKILIGYLIAVLYFTHVSISAEVYEKKGYSKNHGSYWGLIPIYGLIHVFSKVSIKEIRKDSLKQFYSLNEIVMKLLTFAELVFVLIIVILPVVYMVGSSFAATTGLPTTFWPANLTFANYKELFAGTKFTTWWINTFLIAIISMVIAVVFVTGAGYVFARFRFKGKRMMLISILVLQVFPSFMGMIAMFTLYETFGLLGKPLALVIIYVGGSIPFNVWLIKGYLQQIPRDLDESAMLDGANKWQIFTKIILPLSVPILSFVAVSQFMSPWMDYMLPKFLLDVPRVGAVGPDAIKEQWTLAIGLFEMISGADKQNYTTFAAGAMIVALPITIMYMLFQKYLISGITAGATKG